MLVCIFLCRSPTFRKLICGCYLTVDFMAVRKIPLMERSYFGESTSTSASASEECNDRPEDPMVSSFLVKIRETLLSDRASHDKASPHIYYW